MTANVLKTGAPVAVTVELFGIARMKARVNTITVYLDGAATVADLAGELTHKCPAILGDVVQEDGAIADGYALNRNGLCFVPSDPAASLSLAEGDTLLLLPNQAGG